MVKRVSDKDWAKYKSIVNNFINNDSGTQPFLWLKKIEQPLSYGEDSGIVYEPHQLDGLFHYNYIKSWPTNNETIAGESDITNIVLYISADLLRRNKILNEYGYWDFNWSEDRFILNGKVYKPGGDTQVAQAADEALLFFIILYREDISEQKKLLEEYTTDTMFVTTSQGTWLVDSQGKQIKDIYGRTLRFSRDPDIPSINP